MSKTKDYIIFVYKYVIQTFETIAKCREGLSIYPKENTFLYSMTYIAAPPKYFSKNPPDIDIYLLYTYLIYNNILMYMFIRL